MYVAKVAERAITGYLSPDQRSLPMNRHAAQIGTLLMDDSAIMVKTLRRLLTMKPDFDLAGMGVNGREAVDLAARLRPDLAAIDLQMSERDGSGATRLSRSRLWLDTDARRDGPTEGHDLGFLLFAAFFDWLSWGFEGTPSIRVAARVLMRIYNYNFHPAVVSFVHFWRI